jgi:hypothetical protein
LVTLKASVPLTPNFTSPNSRLLLVVVRPAMPVPVSVTCWGLVVALSLSVNDAGRAPTASGVNDTPIVQFVLGAMVIGIAPQVLVPLRAYSESDGIALETTSGWVAPVL